MNHRKHLPKCSVLWSNSSILHNVIPFPTFQISTPHLSTCKTLFQSKSRRETTTSASGPPPPASAPTASPVAVPGPGWSVVVLPKSMWWKASLKASGMGLFHFKFLFFEKKTWMSFLKPWSFYMRKPPFWYGFFLYLRYFKIRMLRTSKRHHQMSQLCRRHVTTMQVTCWSEGREAAQWRRLDQPSGGQGRWGFTTFIHLP